MSDKIFRAMPGAQCVAGDLLVGRVLVGQYRNGQFVMTPEGAKMLEAAPEAAPAPRARKGRAVEAAPETAPDAPTAE